MLSLFVNSLFAAHSPLFFFKRKKKTLTFQFINDSDSVTHSWLVLPCSDEQRSTWNVWNSFLWDKEKARPICLAYWHKGMKQMQYADRAEPAVRRSSWAPRICCPLSSMQYTTSVLLHLIFTLFCSSTFQLARASFGLFSLTETLLNQSKSAGTRPAKPGQLSTCQHWTNPSLY